MAQTKPAEFHRNFKASSLMEVTNYLTYYSLDRNFRQPTLEVCLHSMIALASQIRGFTISLSDNKT
jgi:hypothetical protein